ncbi:hypothetical protein [Pedobacter jamesrossensis]|uniref:Uncharacterized protein n=1 Tax=Pedobacter jamesrossensis TaxID=1908238 RepID=A0ABV8NPX5_9SPHI
MKTRKLFLISALCLFIHEVDAQYVFIPDQNGRPLTDARYENLTGSPYFVDEWTNAEVKLADNNVIKPTEVRYDMVEDKLLFKQDNKVYEFSPKVAAFTLMTKIGNRTFLLKDDGNSESGYYELLSNGKVKLLKKNKKVILETKGYNSANLEKTVDENKKYYVLYNGVEKEVKLNKNSFLNALPEFKDQINKYNSKLSKEEDFIKLTSAFN